ncbi:MAG: hypothetical protein JWN33_235 [Candidatus Saccharibacteria bacterium]|nr:hypothetical protein [Candidatus Saccharibacteria bacterium]
MERIVDKNETYSNRRLSETLEFATRNLQPGPGYHLTLEGVPASNLTRNELEAFFGSELNNDSGAKLELGYDELSKQLVLDKLSFPIRGVEGTAQLIRTDSIGYTPLIEIRGKTFRAASEAMDDETTSRMLTGFNIDTIPPQNTHAYTLWRAELLAQTRGWHLLERLDIPFALDAHAGQMATLMNEEALRPNSFEVIQKRSLTTSIILYPESFATFLPTSTEVPTSYKSHVDVTLETVSGIDNKPVVRQYKQVYKTDPDAAVFGETIYDSRLEAFPITRDSYQSWLSNLQEIIAVRNAIAK